MKVSTLADRVYETKHSHLDIATKQARDVAFRLTFTQFTSVPSFAFLSTFSHAVVVLPYVPDICTSSKGIKTVQALP